MNQQLADLEKEIANLKLAFGVFEKENDLLDKENATLYKENTELYIIIDGLVQGALKLQQNLRERMEIP
jgi:hypothetical protein